MATTSRRPDPAVTSPADDLGLRLDRVGRTPLYRQIERGVRAAIAGGMIPIGARLPPERTLAAALGVDRTTVVRAYHDLTAAGLVEAHVGRGTTVVAAPLPDGTGAAAGRSGRGIAASGPVRPPEWAQRFASRPDEDPALADVAALAARPDVVSFVAGVPAPGAYPTAAFRGLLDEALGAGGEGLLQYCPPEGVASLREAVAARLARRGAPVGAGRVLVCAGSQQGLYLLARAFVEPGDVVAVEAPTYLGALQVFRAAGARLVTIPADRDGLDPDRLGELLDRRSVKLLYVLPTFQNPTGATLPIERRERLLALARRHGVPVIEDDPYGELRYQGTDAPSLLALSPGAASPVVYLSTFSKVLFPGFRLGFVAAPPPVVERLAWEKALVDLDSNPLAQWAVAAFLDRGLLDAHLDRVRRIYPERRDALAVALEREAGGHLSFRRPEGGFYLWARLAAGLRAREVLAEGAATGVAFVPGDLFHADGGGRDAMRLAFSALSSDQLAEGASRLGAAVRAVAARRPARARPGGTPSRIV